MKRILAPTVVAGVGVAVLGAISLFVSSRPDGDLVATRPFEPRLTGVPYGWPPSTRPKRPGQVAAHQLRLKESTESAAPHIRAVSSLLTGNSAKAVEHFSSIAKSEYSAEAFSDFSAALLIRADELDDGDLIVDALSAADRALHMDAGLAAARFNRALALERLGLARHARVEWTEYLRRDPSSRWSDEGWRHLKSLRIHSPAAESRATFAKARSRFTTNDENLGNVVRQFPAICRRATESEVLSDWGSAVLTGQVTVASEHLRFARLIARHLWTDVDERLLGGAIAAIDRAAATGNAQELAEAHVLYNSARRSFSLNKAGEAEPGLRRAAELFARNSSPMVHMARYYLGGVLRARSRLTEAVAVLDSLNNARLESRGYRAIAAQLGWERGGSLLELGAISDAIDTFTASRPALERVGETDAAAWMDAYLANALDFAGDTTCAWRARRRALVKLTRSGNEQRAVTVLQSAVVTAVRRHNWDRARTLLDLIKSAAAVMRMPPMQAHVATELAVVRLHQVGEADVWADIGNARLWVGKVEDPAMRARAEADLAFAEGLARADRQPQQALASFDHAIEFHKRAGRRVEIPRIYLERAKVARRTVGITQARQDLKLGLQVVAEERAALRDLDQRASLVSAAEELFENAIDLAITDRDVDAAFRLAEQSKARMLTDLFELGSRAGRGEVEPIPLTRIQSDLASDAVIIEYVSLPTRFIAFTITRSALSAHVTTIPREEAQAVLSRFSHSIAGGTDDVPGTSATARRLLIGDAEPLVNAAQHVAFVTDRVTSGTPFGGLYDSATTKFLGETVSIASAPSATLLMTASRRAAGLQGNSLLAIAADVFDRSANPSLRSLPHVPKEAAAVADLYSHAKVVVGKQATSAITTLFPTYDVIHFAGHTLADVDRVNQSALLLSPSAADNGNVRLMDITRLRMEKTKLVVLASCRSANEVARNDGAENLALGFVAAGVPSVVANLWELDDGVSLTLMTEIHDRLRRGDTPACAIQSVVKQHARQGSEKEKPVDWAGLVVIGGSPELMRRTENAR